MRLIFNPSGTSHARDALRIENRTEQRRHFTAGEKMKILSGVDAMVATENLPFNMAATRLGVNPISVKTWRKNAVTLSDSSVENKLILHKGPSGIVSEVKEELIEYVEHLSLVAKDQLLTTKHHRGSLHHLRSAAGVAGTRAAPVVCRRPDDVDESPHQTLEHNSTTGTTGTPSGMGSSSTGGGASCTASRKAARRACSRRSTVVVLAVADTPAPGTTK
jgi:hypothetical protein